MGCLWNKKSFFKISGGTCKSEEARFPKPCIQSEKVTVRVSAGTLAMTELSKAQLRFFF